MKHKKKWFAAFMLAIVTTYIYPNSYPVYPDSNHYDSKNKVFHNTTAMQKVKMWVSISSLFELTFAGEKPLPKDVFPTEKTGWARFMAPDESSRFVWLGHATLLMRVGEQTIITDPVFGPSASSFGWMFKRFQDLPVTLDELPEVDTVLISHNHTDHLEKEAMKYFLLQQTHYIVPLGVGIQLQNWGVPVDRITELDWYSSTTRKGVRYTAVPAKHTSGRSLFDANKTLWVGWVIEHNGEKIYHSGDSGYGPHFSEIAEHFNGFDIAFIENGQYDLKWPDHHMQPEQTVQAALDLKAKHFVPIHWGMFSMAFHEWDEPVQQSILLARRKGLMVITPMLGQVFDQNSPSVEWWDVSVPTIIQDGK